MISTYNLRMGNVRKLDKTDIFLYSMILSIMIWIPILYFISSDMVSTPVQLDFLAACFIALLFAGYIFLIWLFVRWIATTAEKAGRSYVSFMILGILFPLIAWIIVITISDRRN
jgi:hypothetical protein